MTITNRIDAVQSLREQVTGAVYLPGDAGYEQHRLTWNRSIDQRPAVIIVAANAQDVAAGVRYAKRNGLAVAVQSTGHGVKYPADDALLIVTSKMTGVTLDADAQTVRVEAGAVWKQVLAVTTPSGLAPLLGSSPYVGVVGYSLGGGIGWLSRRYGLAVDSVCAVEMVTADGVLRHLNAGQDADLFWGVRGGGGTFGVVTAITFDLYPVARLYGGKLVYSGDKAAAALRFFRNWTKTLPDAMTSSIAIMKFPNLPVVPEAMRGMVQVIVRAAYAEDAAEGAALMGAWLDWGTPLINTLRELPFAEVGMISEDPVDPAAVYGSHEMIDILSDEMIDVLVHHATTPESPLAMHELRHAGGAISRADADATAYGNRDAVYYLQMGGPTPTPEHRARMREQITLEKEALKSAFRGSVYLNFFGGAEESQQRIRDAFAPETYDRLVRIKGEYDAENMFRYSSAIKPEGVES